MPNKIVFTTKAKEKNPTKDPVIQVNSLAIIVGRLVATLVKEGKINVNTDAIVSLSMKTDYSGDIMENIVSIKVEAIEGGNTPFPE